MHHALDEKRDERQKQDNNHHADNNSLNAFNRQGTHLAGNEEEM